jgi:RNA polymerase sigma factor (sigma-70 family)
MLNSSLNVAQLNPTQLSERCKQSSADNAHEPYCFELFRRAILRTVDWSECWGCLISIYAILVKNWLRQKIHDLSAEEFNDLVNEVFVRFNQYFTADKLDKSNGQMRSVMTYLKVTANSTAYDVLRGRYRHPEDAVDDDLLDQLPDDVSTESQPVMSVRQSLDAEIERSELNKKIAQRTDELLRNENERAVYVLTFLDELKPKQILQLRPDLFRDESQIYEIKRTLYKRLANDETLQSLYKNHLELR